MSTDEADKFRFESGYDNSQPDKTDTILKQHPTIMSGGFVMG